MKCIQLSNGEVVRTNDEKAREMVRQDRAKYHPKKVETKSGAPKDKGTNKYTERAWTRYLK